MEDWKVKVECKPLPLSFHFKSTVSMYVDVGPQALKEMRHLEPWVLEQRQMAIKGNNTYQFRVRKS